ncbi:nucleoside hydrolase [bacterium]|nr:nucleoside hydrolase [bacterium]
MNRLLLLPLLCLLAVAQTGHAATAAVDSPVKVIIDTDIAEDIDDILVTAFAVASPRFDVLAVTTVDGNTAARSRVARRVTQAFGQPGIPVAEGYARALPWPDTLYTGFSGGVRYGEVAPDEAGLPAPSPLKADALIAQIAERWPGEVTLVTIGSMTNVGRLLLNYPEAARKLKQVVTNGGYFPPGAEQAIGWNLRYDPLAPLLLERSGLRWVLLSESTSGPASPRAEDVERLRAAGLPATELLCNAIDYWHRNKKDSTPLPHVSDLNVFAYLMGLVPVERGSLFLELGPAGGLPGFRVQADPAGAILFGNSLEPGVGARLRSILIETLTDRR